jgi:hypothetical protein
MRKTNLLLLLTILILGLTGCGNKNNTPVSQKDVISPLADVCNYFPKELVENAINKPIVKTEVPTLDSKNCFYYTSYSETYNQGDKPGGTYLVVVYDDIYFNNDRINNEKNGNTYTKDENISMDNYVVRTHSGAIWEVVLILGQDKYLRIYSIQNAITGEELIEIGARFAEKIQSGK